MKLQKVQKWAKRQDLLVSLVAVSIAFLIFALAILATLKPATPANNINNSSPTAKEPIEQKNLYQPGTKLDPEFVNFGVKIDKIQVAAPIIENVDGANKTLYNEALKKGTAHLKGSSFPGRGSNIFIFGHSSSALGKGPYSDIFARLGELAEGDTVNIYRKDILYKYKIFAKSVVAKTDISVTNPTPSEQLTLMTCWPIGTNQQRLVIKASLVAD